MKATDFLTNRTYITLPKKSRPKVYLPFGDSETTQKAFKLYNPFSKKAKILKKVSYFLCLHMKPWARVLLPTIQGKKSHFLVFLEKKLATKCISSVYVATAGDKLVLQLQNSSGIIGYLKYPISELGEKRLLNEQRAIMLLSNKNLIPSLLLTDKYQEVPFIVLQNFDGTIGKVSKVHYQPLLEKFKTTQKFKLREHPRVLNLIENLNTLGFNELKDTMQRLVKASSILYHEVYEHGDFAAWNLIQTQEGLVPFDFEYFEERGLEHLDEIKFHFQEQHLLHHKRGLELIKTIASQVDLKEFDSIFKVFLLKEIVHKAQENEPFNQERELLALVP